MYSDYWWYSRWGRAIVVCVWCGNCLRWCLLAWALGGPWWWWWREEGLERLERLEGGEGVVLVLLVLVLVSDGRSDGWKWRGEGWRGAGNGFDCVTR